VLMGIIFKNRHALGHLLMAGAVLRYVRCVPRGIIFLELALVGASPHGGLLGPIIYLYSPPPRYACLRGEEAMISSRVGF